MMILPASTSWPPYFLTPRRRPALSRPLRELPPAFLCAMAVAPYFFFLAPDLALPDLAPPDLPSPLAGFLARASLGCAVRPVGLAAFFLAVLVSSSSSALGAFACLAGLGAASLRGEGLAPSVRISSMRTS